MRRAEHARDRRYIAQIDEIEIGIERSVDRIGRAIKQKRVTVRLRMNHKIGPDIAARTAAVFDHEGLAEPLRQRLPNLTRNDVADAASRKRHNKPYRPFRIGFGFRWFRNESRGGETHCRKQKTSA